MRFVGSTAVLLLLSACAVEPPPREDDPPVEDPEPEFDHVCDALKYEAAQAGEPWSPPDLDDCFAGCDDGELAGYDQGRLVCITDGEFCPDCVADQDGVGFDAGYKACFASSYRQGYADEGCLEA